MSEIFISYKREERVKAHSIAEALAKHGFSVWWDIDLLPGDKFADEISSVIDNAKAAIVLWSESAVTSDFVRAEASRASNRDILIPVRLDDCKPPFPFGILHTLDLRNWDGSINDPSLAQLIEAIEKKIGRSSSEVESGEAVEEMLERPRGEVEFWRSISNPKNQEAKEYKAYLEKYGKAAIFYQLAEIRIQKLNASKNNTTRKGSRISLVTAGLAAIIVGTLIVVVYLYVSLNSKSEPVDAAIPNSRRNAIETESGLRSDSWQIVNIYYFPTRKSDALKTKVALQKRDYIVNLYRAGSDLKGAEDRPSYIKFRDLELMNRTKSVVSDLLKQEFNFSESTKWPSNTVIIVLTDRSNDA